MSDSTTRPPQPPPPVTGYPAPPPPRSNGHQPYFSSATAYPYAAPQPPSNYYYASNPDPRRAAFIRRFLLAVISVFIVIGCIFFILWLVLRPRIPEFHIASLSVSNFSLSTTSSSQTVTGNFRAQFRVVNPNKKVELGYSDVRSLIAYHAQDLAFTTIPPFKQETGNVTTVEASYSATNLYLEKGAATDLAGERSRGEVKFEVKFTARMGLKAGAWRWRDRFLRVLCDDVKVGVSGNSTDGKLVGGERDCIVAI